jgi:hypothetical protein
LKSLFAGKGGAAGSGDGGGMSTGQMRRLVESLPQYRQQLAKLDMHRCEASQGRPLAWDAFRKTTFRTLARGTMYTWDIKSLLGLITLFSSLVFDTVATPLHQLGSGVWNSGMGGWTNWRHQAAPVN